jgi:hypothetical protein
MITSAVILTLAGCGGSSSDNKSCADACNTLFNCGTKLNVTPETFLGPNYATVSSCISRCTTSTCAKNQQLVNCGAALQCNSLSQVETDAEACFTNAGCTP